MTMDLGRISLLTIPVTDQERAKAFYTDALGFDEKIDYAMDTTEAGAAGSGARWLMLSPPQAGPDIVLSTWTTPPGTSHVSIETDNIETTWQTLTNRGLTIDQRPQDAAWGRWFQIHDPDGNTWLIVQPPSQMDH
ncbi:VOC family protein [Janibacter indicus]